MAPQNILPNLGMILHDPQKHASEGLGLRGSTGEGGTLGLSGETMGDTHKRFAGRLTGLKDADDWVGVRCSRGAVNKRLVAPQ